MDPGFFANPDPVFKSPDPDPFINKLMETFFSRIRIRIFGRSGSGLRKKKSDPDPGKKAGSETLPKTKVTLTFGLT